MTNMNKLLKIVNNIKSKDKKLRYKALEGITHISRSRKIKQKIEILKILNEKSFSLRWEEKYISMYALSRFMWRGGKFKDLKQAYHNVIRLLEDNDGRVRMAAFNALVHFRSFFVMFAYGAYSDFDEKEIVKLWTDSLFLLWDKTKSIEKSKKQQYLMKCIDTLFIPDMEDYLSKKDYKKYKEIWDKLQEIEEIYNESERELCY